MDDQISRAEAIEGFESLCRTKGAVEIVWGIRRLLNKLPAVDAVPVVHAHYVKGSNGEWYCSNCRRIDDKYSVARYCWNCGAKMDSEQRQEETPEPGGDD